MKYACTLLVLATILFSPVVLFAAPAELTVSTPKKAVTAGELFTVEVRVRSTNQPVNAVSGVVSFPVNLLRPISITTESGKVNFWTRQPKFSGSTIPFEGVILNPGYQGPGVFIFKATFEARKPGVAQFKFTEGAVLAHDGQGTNLLTGLLATSVRVNAPGEVILPPDDIAVVPPEVPKKVSALPVITDYTAQVVDGMELYIRGKGEPNALTKLLFNEAAEKSVGERFIQLLQTKKQKLDAAYIQNNAEGIFEYRGPKELIAGVYNATPFLVDTETNTEKPGLGKQLLVSDSKLVRALVVMINVLALLVPVVALVMVIYFIPWYSLRRMRLLKKQLGYEEEKIVHSEHQLHREDKVLDNTAEKITQQP